MLSGPTKKRPSASSSVSSSSSSRKRFLLFRRLPKLVVGTAVVVFLGILSTNHSLSYLSTVLYPDHEKEESVQQPILGPGWWISVQDKLVGPQERRHFEWEQSRRATLEEDSSRVRQSFQTSLLDEIHAPERIALQAKSGFAIKEPLRLFQSEEKKEFEMFVNDTRLLPQDFGDVNVSVSFGNNNDTTVTSAIFDHIWVMKSEDGPPASKKHTIIVAKQLFQQRPASCIVYSASFDETYESEFENEFAKDFNCSVHTFNCQLQDRRRLKSFLKQQEPHENLGFHPWCIGETNEDNDEQNTASASVTSTFVSFDKVVERLDHSVIDLFKFQYSDGYEWKLLNTLLLSRTDTKLLPQQMIFELHSRGDESLQHYRQPWISLSSSKINNETWSSYSVATTESIMARIAVVQLFNRLYDFGYRVVSKRVSEADPYLAEFAVYRFYGKQPRQFGSRRAKQS